MKPRFEIVGELGGTLETVIPLPLLDAGRGGVLADSPVPLAMGSLHRIRLLCDGEHASVQAAVRHVRQMTVSTGEQRYLIGFEFENQSPALQELVDRWMRVHGEAAS